MEQDEDEDDLDRDLDLAFSTLNRDSLLFQDGGGLHVMGGVPKQQHQHGQWCSCSQHCNKPTLWYVGSAAASDPPSPPFFC